jgi:hypothetical protein
MKPILLLTFLLITKKTKIMISIRELQRKYTKLQEQVKTDSYFKIDLTNRVNCYTCTKCGHITKTKDIDPGVIPFMFTCEKCNSTATSSFLKDIAPKQQPTIEWYRPSFSEVLKMRKRPELLDHIFNGGLGCRKIKKS